MKIQSRAERGRQNMKYSSYKRKLSQLQQMENPFKGGNKVASAEVAMKGAGLFLGFSFKF
jgi:hypothetical protein